MLEPRKVKYRKQHRGRTGGISKGATELAFGEYGIQALEPGWITARQIEAARIAMTRHIKPGRVLFELSYPNSATAHQALERAVQKLPIKARIISREEAI